MKNVLKSVAVLISLTAVHAQANTNAEAGLNTYRANQHTCVEIQQIVQNEGSINLIGGLFGTSQLVSSSCNRSNAGGDGQFGVAEIMATADNPVCIVGLSCIDDGGN